MEELRRRIESRGTEKETEMAMRFDSARREIADLSDFDYVIINTDMERAKDRLSAIILGERIAHGDCLCEVQRRSRDDNSNPA